MNEAVELSAREKLVLALRLIDFYLRQMEGKDYSSHTLEAIVVHNYSPSNPSLMAVRVNRSLEDRDDYSSSEADAVWNLAFVLDNLFMQSLDRDKDFGELPQEGELIDSVTALLENKEGSSFYSVVQLRKLAEEAVTLRKH